MEANSTVLRIAENHSRSVSDRELLSLLLGAPLERVDQLLESFESLAGIARASVDDLARIVGAAKAARLVASLEMGRRSMRPTGNRPRLRLPSQVNAYYQPRLGHLGTEVFHVACLNTQNRLLRDARVAEGGFASCGILPREVFAPAMAAKAVGVVLVHNHPSGETEASADDLQLTRRLFRAGETLGIRVLDHVIVGEGAYTSLAERGQLSDVAADSAATSRG